MATIVKTSMAGSGSRAVAVTTLGASDTFVYDASKNPVLVLNNVTGGALTPNIDGDGGSTVPVAGVGDVDVSGGYDVPSIPAGDSAAIPLNSIAEYLKDTIEITVGVGIEAQILEF